MLNAFEVRVLFLLWLFSLNDSVDVDCLSSIMKFNVNFIHISDCIFIDDNSQLFFSFKSDFDFFLRLAEAWTDSKSFDIDSSIELESF